jgi:hypothetical protein
MQDVLGWHELEAGRRRPEAGLASMALVAGLNLGDSVATVQAAMDRLES